MDGTRKKKAGLIIVNSEYVNYETLEYPASDGAIMMDILHKALYDMVKIVKNSEDILKDIDEYIEETKEKNFEVIHFHYSGNLRMT